MKSTGFAAALLLWTFIGQSQTMSVPQARAHDGENATVCGKIQNEHSALNSKGKPTFLDLDSAFPDQILVWDDDRPHVGPLPRTGAHVCVSGTINYYHGVAQIVVKNSGQFSSDSRSSLR
jgi:hypothetical protein